MNSSDSKLTFHDREKANKLKLSLYIDLFGKRHNLTDEHKQILRILCKDEAIRKEVHQYHRRRMQKCTSKKK